MALRRIPAFLTLPGPGEESYIVRIQLVKDAKLNDEGANADFDSDTRTIRLPKGARRQRRLFLLDHELQHATSDWLLWLQQQLGNRLAE